MSHRDLISSPGQSEGDLWPLWPTQFMSCRCTYVQAFLCWVTDHVTQVMWHHCHVVCQQMAPLPGCLWWQTPASWDDHQTPGSKVVIISFIYWTYTLFWSAMLINILVKKCWSTITWRQAYTYNCKVYLFCIWECFQQFLFTYCSNYITTGTVFVCVLFIIHTSLERGGHNIWQSNSDLNGHGALLCISYNIFLIKHSPHHSIIGLAYHSEDIPLLNRIALPGTVWQTISIVITLYNMNAIYDYPQNKCSREICS